MRGKDWGDRLRCHVAGITPAYAGKSLAVGVLWIHDKDHPRLCGEKEKKPERNATVEGSPPPMRGKGGANSKQPVKLRITPAYAGKRCVIV